jgi:hypothetical protein
MPGWLAGWLVGEFDSRCHRTWCVRTHGKPWACPCARPGRCTAHGRSSPGPRLSTVSPTIVPSLVCVCVCVCVHCGRRVALGACDDCRPGTRADCLSTRMVGQRACAAHRPHATLGAGGRRGSAGARMERRRVAAGPLRRTRAEHLGHAAQHGAVRCGTRRGVHGGFAALLHSVPAAADCASCAGRSRSCRARPLSAFGRPLGGV